MTFQRGQRLTAEQLETRLTNAESYSVGKPVDTWSSTPIDRNFGADCSAVFNLAIQASAAAGEVLLVPPGNYMLAAPIYVRSGLRMICSPRAVFQGRFSGGGVNGVVMVPGATTTPHPALDPATRERDIIIQGGRWGVQCTTSIDPVSGYSVSSSDTYGYECTIFNLFADDLQLLDIVVDGYPVQRGFQICGDRVYARRPILLNPNIIYTGTGNSSGGFRFGGGEDFLCVDGFGVSADDFWQLVPFSAGGKWQDLTIKNARYVNCGGVALKNRLAAGVLVDCPTASIINSGWTGLRGYATGNLIGLSNLNSTGTPSTGRVDGIVIDNFHVEDLGLYDQPQSVAILSQSDTGGMGQITFSNGEIGNAKTRAILCTGDIDCLTFRNVKMRTPDPTLSDKSVIIRGPKRLIIEGCDIGGGIGSNVMTIGTNAITDYDTTCARVTIRDTVFRDIPDTFYAVQLTNTAGAVLDNVACVAASGATANGVKIASTCANVEVRRLDCTDMGGGTTVDDLGATGTITGIVLT